MIVPVAVLDDAAVLAEVEQATRQERRPHRRERGGKVFRRHVQQTVHREHRVEPATQIEM